jgi:hypothetical protein
MGRCIRLSTQKENYMAKKLGTSPWLEMWVRPRSTIRSIVQFNPMHQFYLLAGVYGFPMLLQFAQSLSLGQQFGTLGIIIVALVLAIIAGTIGIYISSALIYWTGKWIGGKGSFPEVRASVAWSNVTNVVNVILWLILAGYFGTALFTNTFTQTPFVGTELMIVSAIFIIQTVLAVWSFIILLLALAEVQRYSVWRAFLNLVIPFLIVTAAVWLLLMGMRWMGGM